VSNEQETTAPEPSQAPADGLQKTLNNNKFSLIGLVVGLLSMAVLGPIGLIVGLVGALLGGFLGDKGGKDANGNVITDASGKPKENGFIAEAGNWLQNKISPEPTLTQKVAHGALNYGATAVGTTMLAGAAIKTGRAVLPTVTKAVTGPLKWAKDLVTTGLSPITWALRKIGVMGAAETGTYALAGEEAAAAANVATKTGFLARAGSALRWAATPLRMAAAWGTETAIPTVTAAGGSVVAGATTVAEAIPLAGAGAVAGTAVAISAVILSPFAYKTYKAWEEVDNYYKPDMEKFKNFKGVQAVLSRDIEANGGIKDKNGQFSFLDPRTAQKNVDATMAAIEQRKAKLTSEMEANKPSWITRYLQFTEAQGKARSDYENRRMEVKQLEIAELELRGSINQETGQQQKGYLATLYENAKNNQAEQQRLAAAAEQATKPVADKPIQTVANVGYEESVMPGQTPAKPKQTGVAGNPLALKQATVSREG